METKLTFGDEKLTVKQELELCEKASAGKWERLQAEGSHFRYDFVRAPSQIIPNDRGPSYPAQVLADDSYPTKDADHNFVAHFDPVRVKEMLLALEDVDSHYGDFKTAIDAQIKFWLDNQNDPDAEPNVLYWRHQLDVLDRIRSVVHRG